MIGLMAEDMKTLRGLPPRMRSLVVQELDDPESAEVIVELLRSGDPAHAIAREISLEVAEEVYSPVDELPEAGMGKKKGRGFKKLKKKVGKIHSRITKLPKPLRKVQEKFEKPFKKVEKKVRKVVKKVGRAVTKTVKKIGKPIVKFGRRYGALIVTAIGIIVAPMTGGASLIVAGLIASGISMAQKKREAKKLEQAGKKEAKAMAAEVAVEESKLLKETDDLYQSQSEVFNSAGISQDQWKSMNLDYRLAIMEKLQKGEIQATPEAIGAAREAGQILPEGTEPSPTAGGYVVPEEKAPPEDSPEAEEYEEEPESVGPSGTYEVLVEGHSVGTVANSADAAALVARTGSPGSRLEVLMDGKSTGLKIMTKSGLIAVPPSEEAGVRAMPDGEVRSMVARAEAAAKKAEPRGFPWWLLAIPVVAVAATS